MRRSETLALFISLLAVAAAYLVAEGVFEGMAHIEDEIAYVWQAQAISRGHLTLPTPAHKESFLVPFVVDTNGQRSGKYPLGWPAALAIGEFFGARSWVNAILAGLGVWLTYKLGKRLFSDTVGLLAAGLTLTSPFFLMNSGSLLSHPLGLFLSAAFALSWLDAWDDRSPHPNLAAVTAGATLGLLALTRPLTAVAVALPFVPHGLYLLLRKDAASAAVRRRLLLFTLIVLALAALTFLWQYAVTGDPLKNPYTLWWEYDKIGFGPGVGRKEAGHTLRQARINTEHSLWVGWHDYFGWGGSSWLFLPFGVITVLYKRRWKALPALAVFPSLVFVYLAYWIGSWLYGPRYFYEGLYSLTLGSAAGIAFLAGWPLQDGEKWPNLPGWRRLRPLGVTALLALLVSANLLFYTPTRLQGMYALYGVSRARLQPFLAAQAQGLTPALVIAHVDHWTEYGALLELTDPFLDTPFLMVMSVGEYGDHLLAADYPDRRIFSYDPKDPWVLREIHFASGP